MAECTGQSPREPCCISEDEPAVASRNHDEMRSRSRHCTWAALRARALTACATEDEPTADKALKELGRFVPLPLQSDLEALPVQQRDLEVLRSKCRAVAAELGAKDGNGLAILLTPNRSTWCLLQSHCRLTDLSVAHHAAQLDKAQLVSRWAQEQGVVAGAILQAWDAAPSLKGSAQSAASAVARNLLHQVYLNHELLGAAKADRVKEIAPLLQSKANLRARDASGNTPLHLASSVKAAETLILADSSAKKEIMSALNHHGQPAVFLVADNMAAKLGPTGRQMIMMKLVDQRLKAGILATVESNMGELMEDVADTLQSDTWVKAWECFKAAFPLSHLSQLEGTQANYAAATNINRALVTEAWEHVVNVALRYSPPTTQSTRRNTLNKKATTELGEPDADQASAVEERAASVFSILENLWQLVSEAYERAILAPAGSDRQLGEFGMRVCSSILNGISSASRRVHPSLHKKLEALGTRFWSIVMQSQLRVEAAHVVELWAALSGTKSLRTTFMKSYFSTNAITSSNIWVSPQVRPSSLSTHTKKKNPLTKQLEARTHLKISNLSLPEVIFVAPPRHVSDVLHEVTELRQLGWNFCACSSGLFDNDLYKAQFGRALSEYHDLPSPKILAARSLWYMELVRVHGDAVQKALRQKLWRDDVVYKQSRPLDFMQAWSQIMEIFELAVQVTSPEDRIVVHGEFEDSITYIRNLFSAKLIASLQVIKELIDMCQRLSWATDGMLLLRTENNCQNENPCGGHRNFVLHVAVRVPMDEGLRLMLVRRRGQQLPGTKSSQNLETAAHACTSASAKIVPGQQVAIVAELVCMTPAMDLLQEASGLFDKAARGVYDIFGAKRPVTPTGEMKDVTMKDAIRRLQEAAFSRDRRKVESLLTTPDLAFPDRTQTSQSLEQKWQEYITDPNIECARQFLAKLDSDEVDDPKERKSIPSTTLPDEDQLRRQQEAAVKIQSIQRGANARKKEHLPSSIKA